MLRLGKQRAFLTMFLVSISMWNPVGASCKSHRSSLRHGRSLQETCIENLQQASQEGSTVVTSADFLTFLSLQSNGTFDFDDFSDIPLDLRLLFYATACSGGQDCTDGPPTINVSASEGMAFTLLQIFCSRVETFLQTTQELLQVSFQYNLYYQTNLSTEEILNRQRGSTIVDRLEVATKRVVMEALGCGVDVMENNDSARRLQLQPHGNETVLHVQSHGFNDYIHVMTTEEQEHCGRHNHDSSRLLQDADCAYTVTAVVDDLMSYACDPPPQNDDIQCAIVASTVSLVPVDNRPLSEEERAQLRAMVVSAMLDSIDNGSFKEHLP